MGHAHAMPCPKATLRPRGPASHGRRERGGVPRGSAYIFLVLPHSRAGHSRRGRAVALRGGGVVLALTAVGFSLLCFFFYSRRCSLAGNNRLTCGVRSACVAPGASG